VVDLDSRDLSAAETDPEENAADRYALEVLTGKDSPQVLSSSGQGGAQSLADSAMKASRELGIEPGTLALCFGYSTKKWAVANGAMRYIYAGPKPVWQEVNNVARGQLAFDSLAYDSQMYLSAVLGAETVE
jgi:hypothetical protein